MSVEPDETSRLLRRDKRTRRLVSFAVGVGLLAVITLAVQSVEGRLLAQSNRASLQSTHTLVVKLQTALNKSKGQTKAAVKLERELFFDLHILLAYDVSLCQHVTNCHQVGLR